MIKMIISDLNIYESIDSTNNYLIVIQNKKILYKILSDLGTGSSIDGFVKIYDNEKRVNFSDYIEFIPSLINIDVNNKKNINALLRYFKVNFANVLENYSNKINNLMSEVLKIINVESPVLVDSNKAFTEEELVKALNITINESSSSLLEKISQYIDFICELRGIKKIIFYELSTFLEENELQILIKNVNYKGISIINIESHNDNIKGFDHKKILDYDCCLIE